MVFLKLNKIENVQEPQEEDEGGESFISIDRFNFDKLSERIR